MSEEQKTQETETLYESVKRLQSESTGGDKVSDEVIDEIVDGDPLEPWKPVLGVDVRGDDMEIGTYIHADGMTPEQAGKMLAEVTRRLCAKIGCSMADVAGPYNADLYGLAVEDIAAAKATPEPSPEPKTCNEMVSYGAPRCGRKPGHDGDHRCGG
jgi:hypothetical protein